MKSKILFSFLGVVVLFVLIMAWNTASVNADKNSENDSVISLNVSSDKQSYIQGEIVTLTFEAINETDKAVSVSDVSDGYLNVWIAVSGQKFYRYNNTSWGRSESGGKIVQPGQSYKSQATVMWNSKPQIPPSVDGNILTDYAFPEPGVYLVKAVLSIPSNTSETLTKIESKPIQITINKPVGEDSEVWNKIKDNGDIANFMHRGSFFGADSEENLKIFKEMETIVENYPNSLLANQLKPHLEKFHTNENLRKLYLEKRNKPQ